MSSRLFTIAVSIVFLPLLVPFCLSVTHWHGIRSIHCPIRWTIFFLSARDNRFYRSSSQSQLHMHYREKRKNSKKVMEELYKKRRDRSKMEINSARFKCNKYYSCPTMLRQIQMKRWFRPGPWMNKNWQKQVLQLDWMLVFTMIEKI